jgi:hypothetical protein
MSDPRPVRRSPNREQFMASTSRTPSRRSEVRVYAGLLAFAIGTILLVAGGLQRYDGRLSWGGRSGPMKTLARQEDPQLFDRVTLGLIASGLLLSGGGLAVAYAASGIGSRRRGEMEIEQ